MSKPGGELERLFDNLKYALESMQADHEDRYIDGNLYTRRSIDAYQVLNDLRSLQEEVKKLQTDLEDFLTDNPSLLADFRDLQTLYYDLLRRYETLSIHHNDLLARQPNLSNGS